jgi:3alpha(or 20beta)-hydroxysteroid dehydrogenase
MSRLTNKVALITGGAQGQGAAHAELLAGEGADVVIGDILDDQGEAVAHAIRSRGHSARYRHLDVTDLEDWAAAIALAEQEFGRLNVVVNNAGVANFTPLLDCTDDEWNRTIAVNQTGVFYGMRSTVPALQRAGGGSIVNVSSIFGGIRGTAAHIAYTASKAAVVAMTHSVAKSYAADNIRANAIAPGAVETPMYQQDIDFWGAEAMTAFVQAQPITRVAAPIEMSYAVLFLASDESSYITGVTIAVDGGATI